jgi:hypothetical protein
MRSLAVLAVVMCLIGLAGCGSSKPKDLIVGKWELLDENGKGTGKFDIYTKEGKVTWENGDNPRDYKVTDDGKIEFIKDGRTFATYKIEVTKDSLTLTSGDNRVEKFKRTG